MDNDNPRQNTARSHIHWRWHHGAALTALLLAQLALAADSRQDVLREAALATQKQCQMLLHHDAQDYVDCVDARLRAESKPGARRLGIAYFGWVGALNSARMSFPGAHDAADHYLRQFRRLQRRLKVTDDELCASVPGDCVQRNARMAQMEKLAPVRDKHFDGATGEGHRH